MDFVPSILINFHLCLKRVEFHHESKLSLLKALRYKSQTNLVGVEEHKNIRCHITWRLVSTYDHFPPHRKEKEGFFCNKVTIAKIMSRWQRILSYPFLTVGKLSWVETGLETIKMDLTFRGKDLGTASLFSPQKIITWNIELYSYCFTINFCSRKGRHFGSLYNVYIKQAHLKVNLIILLQCSWNEILSNTFLIALGRSVKMIIQLLW